MYSKIIQGISIPFLGTILGSACVFMLKNKLGANIQKLLNGFAGGVMLAASIWSLIIPSIEGSQSYGRFAFLPATIGFWIGVLFLIAINKFFPRRYY